MNDTTAKKTNIYAVQVSRSDTPAINLLVRAESRAQARGFVASTMISVGLASQDDLLGVKREDVVDARHPPANPDQGTLLDAGEPTAAQALEGGDGE